jgi:hypothetical protein
MILCGNLQLKILPLVDHAIPDILLQREWMDFATVLPLGLHHTAPFLEVIHPSLSYFYLLDYYKTLFRM